MANISEPHGLCFYHSISSPRGSESECGRRKEQISRNNSLTIISKMSAPRVALRRSLQSVPRSSRCLVSPATQGPASHTSKTPVQSLRPFSSTHQSIVSRRQFSSSARQQYKTVEEAKSKYRLGVRPPLPPRPLSSRSRPRSVCLQLIY